jgi:RimJ/RimL family protein N-acetyltransferase
MSSLSRPRSSAHGSWKLLIDHRHQGKGYGREVVRQIVELVRDEGATELFTGHVPGEGGPAGFYARLGFVPTGELDRTERSSGGEWCMSDPRPGSVSMALM